MELTENQLKENKERYNELNNSQSGYFECQMQVLKETDKAICFNKYAGYLNHEKPVWVPKSQMVILDLGKNEAGTRYFIKNWLYKNFK